MKGALVLHTNLLLYTVYTVRMLMNELKLNSLFSVTEIN